MNREVIDLRIKRVEREIPRSSAKIADAVTLLQADAPATCLLIEAQLALERLYILMGE